MLTRQQKIDAIYEKIANKELSFGCRIQLKSPSDGRIEEDIVISDKYNSSSVRGRQYRIIFKEYISKNIGHPVMLGDVMDFLDEKIRPYGVDCGCGEFYYAEGENTAWMIDLWENKRKPIEDQSDECIDFIYNLISKKGEK